LREPGQHTGGGKTARSLRPVCEHVFVLDSPGDASSLTAAAPAGPVVSATRQATRQAVAERLAAGLSKTEVAKGLGITKATVSYHVRRLGAAVDLRCARRYDWSRIQAYYNQGHSLAECQDQFGFSRQSWFATVNRGALRPRPTAMAIEELCVAGVLRSRHNVKNRLLAARLKEGRCEECGLDRWRGRPLSLQLHHRNGAR